jgi:hypothetical protein
MRETWIGIENYQTMTIFCVDHNLLTPKLPNILLAHH